MGDADERARRLVETAVYAPIGLAVVVGERLPELVATGRERIEQRVTLARFIGRMAVEQGRRELIRRFSEPAPAHPIGRASAARVAPVRPAVPPTATTNDATSARSPEAPGVDELALDDYESLSASQVVDRLDALSSDELDDIEAFERAHRSRRTVLGKIARLQESA